MSTVAIAPPTNELVLGRYRPVRPLGSGGSGSVWLALDERNGLDVALKIIPREGKAAARAEREAHAARRLRHDRCVRAYHVGHDASHVYIAYEYVPGRTLREAVRAGEMSDTAAVEAAAQVLDALAHAHRMGIVHRDVKPANILLQDGDETSVRLLDFGLAQFDGAETLTAVGDVPGTLAYIAPERLAGADATAQSDVWSVGVVLWETLAGRHPFWGVPLQEVARAIQAGAPPLATERPKLPRRLCAAVDRALALDPAARPRAAELAADVRSALRKATGRPARRSPVEVPGAVAPARRHAQRVVPMALAALATALGATLLPFWPTALVVTLTLAAALATRLDPRLGLAVALAAPVLPIGNYAQGAALAYSAFALAWLLLMWRDARAGLLFATGPVLAGLGLLALAPLAALPARGLVRRSAQAGLAVLAAALVAGISDHRLPIGGGTVQPLGVTPLDPPGAAALAAWDALVAHPAVLVGAAFAALAAGVLPWARRHARYGVATVGLVLVVGSALAGAGVGATILVTVAWAAVTLVSATARPSS